MELKPGDAHRLRMKERKEKGLGAHKLKETAVHKRKHERTGKCLVCNKRSDVCECAGHMTQSAQERFFA